MLTGATTGAVRSSQRFTKKMRPTIAETTATHTAADGRWLLFRTRRAMWIWLRANDPEALS